MKSVRWMSLIAASVALASTGAAQGADKVADSAAVYMTYQTDADEVAAKPFKSTSDIDAALQSLGGYNADQLTKGWIAYSALIAAQDPEFRSTVREIEAFYGRDAMVNGFSKGGKYARSLDGGDNAVGAAIDATDKDVTRLYSAGAIVKEQGYSLQGYGWAKSRIRNGDSRAASVKVLQSQSRFADSGLVAALTGASEPLTGLQPAAGVAEGVTTVASAVRLPQISALSRRKPKFGREGVADQIASLAALRIMGTATIDQTKLSAAMLDPSVQSCMKMQNLQLQGCVAGVGQEFELPHCISQHALTEIGDCLGDVYK